LTAKHTYDTHSKFRYAIKVTTNCSWLTFGATRPSGAYLQNLRVRWTWDKDVAVQAAAIMASPLAVNASCAIQVVHSVLGVSDDDEIHLLNDGATVAS